MSNIKAASIASLECNVGYHTCYKVMFKGKPIASPATQRVRAWMRENGFKRAAVVRQGEAAPPTTDALLSSLESEAEGQGPAQ